jgi:hypothetical protein
MTQRIAHSLIGSDLQQLGAPLGGGMPAFSRRADPPDY